MITTLLFTFSDSTMAGFMNVSRILDDFDSDDAGSQPGFDYSSSEEEENFVWAG